MLHNLGPPTRDELRGRIRRVVIEQTDADPAALTCHTQIDELGSDTVCKLELTMAIEDAFDLEIPDPALDQLQTLQDLIDYVADRLAI